MNENEPQSFGDVELSDAVFRETLMSRVRMVGVVLVDAVIDGYVKNLTVNGVEVTGFVEAELDRRFPVRPLLRSSDPDDMREGWRVVLADWQATTARIGALSKEGQNRRVNGEWSAIETLRHLVFVSDGWFRRSVLGVPEPFHPIGLAAAFMPDPAAMGLDTSARPTLAEVVEIRVGQQREITEFLAGLTIEELDRHGSASDRPGWPADPEKHTVLACLQTLFDEEFAHHQFCVRDLATISAG